MSRSTRDRRPTWRIGDVLDRTDLAALLDELADGTQRLGPGRRWHCPMPDHDDYRASVTMHRDHRGHERWRCWSGDHRGDAIDLVMVSTGRDRRDAIDWLAGRAGMAPDRPLPPIRRRRSSPHAAPARVMDPIVARYVDACTRVLDSSAGRPVVDWLRARGLDDSTIRANRLGADPGRTRMRRRRGLPYGAGIAATFPIYDAAGNLTYVQTRYLDVGETGRKYDNPAAALAPHPRLGFAVSPRDLRDAPLLVCEGMPDALTAAQEGFEAVGLLGAHTPDDSVAARLANHLDNTATGRGAAIVTDPDQAGHRVAAALAPMLAERGHTPRVITPPDGHDLNDWALADPEWTTRLETEIAIRHPQANTPTIER